MTYEQLLDTVVAFYSDTHNRTVQETKEDLEALKEEIELLIETLS